MAPANVRRMSQILSASTGEERALGVEDVFFSVTDAKGVITHVNSTFVELSRYSHKALIGSPHNVIRHDGMPGGAFHLVWQELHEGRPVCAYVANLADDGVRYDVFATIVPVPDGYLSVRLLPSSARTAEVLWQAYDGVRAEERRLRAEGASRNEAADSGARDLLTRIASVGFGSMAAFTRAALPQEFSGFVRAGGGIPERPEATGELATALAAARRLYATTSDLVSQLEEYGAVATRVDEERPVGVARVEALVSAVEDALAATAIMEEVAHQTVESTQDGDLRESQEDRLLRMRELAAAAERFSGRAREDMEALTARLSEVSTQIHELMLRIALLGLHTVTVGHFLAEIIDGRGDDRAHDSMRVLRGAMSESLSHLSDEVVSVQAVASEVPAVIADAVSVVDRTRRRLDRWSDVVTGLVEQARAGDRGPEVWAATERARAGAREDFDVLNRLSAIAAELGLLRIPFDRAELESLFGAVEYETENAAASAPSVR